MPAASCISERKKNHRRYSDVRASRISALPIKRDADPCGDRDSARLDPRLLCKEKGTQFHSLVYLRAIRVLLRAGRFRFLVVYGRYGRYSMAVRAGSSTRRRSCYSRLESQTSYARKSSGG